MRWSSSSSKSSVPASTKGKDGKEITTVNIILKKWAGDKDAMQLLKNVPNLQVVYIDSNQVNDAALGPLKDPAGLSALTIMSPQVTDAALENLKSLSGLTMLFLTNSKVSDKGLVQLKGLKNLQVLALSRTEVTDAGLDALKDIKSLKSIYLIGHSCVRRSHGLLCRCSEQPPKTDQHSSQADRDAQGKPDHRHAQ